MSGSVITTLSVVGFIAFWIVLAIAAKNLKPKAKVRVRPEIADQDQVEAPAREEAVKIKSQAEVDESAREQRAKGRAAIQARIDALTKEQDERKAIAEKMTVRLNVPLVVPPIPRPLQDKYAGLIKHFYEIAERKVSLRDEYGDENWEVLDKEIGTVIKKIAQKEGVYQQSDRRKNNPDISGVFDASSLPEEYFQLTDFLKKSFREHYEKRRSHAIKQPDFAIMSGLDFEAYVMDLLGRLGYIVCGTPTTGDQGADILAKKDGKTIVIQAKNYCSTVGNAAVQQVAAAVRFYDGHEGWVVTNSTFTQSARELAQRNDVRLIDGIELLRISSSASTILG